MQFHVYLDIFIRMIIYFFELDILTWCCFKFISSTLQKSTHCHWKRWQSWFTNKYMTIIDLFKANESMKPMKLIQTPHQENTNNMSPYVSQLGIPAQMEINEVVSLLSSSLRKFNFLSEAPFIYELITMTLLATLKVHCPLCLKIIRCKLLLCHYIKHIIKSF